MKYLADVVFPANYDSPLVLVTTWAKVTRSTRCFLSS